MKKSALAVSVIMPVYNTKEEYFREAVESILAQTFTDFELLISDNASEPYIKNIVKSYTDPRIVYLRLDVNRGPSGARNFAIERASGKYLAMIDSDDVSLPERLAEEVAYMEAHPETGCLGTEAEIIGDDAAEMSSDYFRSRENISGDLVLNGCPFCQSSVMFRKSVIDKYGIRYREEYNCAEDYAFYVDLLGRTEFKILDKKLIKYRFFTGNTSHTCRKRQLEAAKLVQKEAARKYFSVKSDVIPNLITGSTLTDEQIAELPSALEQMSAVLQKKGYSAKESKRIVKKKLKKLYYHTHSFKQQLALLKSLAGKTYGLSTLWRFMCFLTRGIL